jgi:membrane associated rhomboid family serine protease
MIPMKNYLLENRPRISLILIIVLFVSNILTLVISQLYNIVLLFPSNLSEPWNWYKLITYPLYVGGLKTWFLNSLVIILTGYIIESRVKKADMIGLILISSIIGGLFFILLNQSNEFNAPIATPTMISWGYWTAAIVIGLKYFKSLNLFEKIVLFLCFLSIFSLWNDNFGFLIGQIGVIVTVLIITIFRVKVVK